jgi:hypothetical protein
VVVGNRNVRWSEQATCVRAASFEGAHTDQRAAVTR